MDAKKVNISDEELDRYHLKARKICTDFINESNNYSTVFIQHFYNMVLLPQIIVDDTLGKYKDTIIHVTIPGLKTRIYIRYNNKTEIDKNMLGYTYSVELIA